MTRPTRPTIIGAALLLPLAALPAIALPDAWAFWLAAVLLGMLLIAFDLLFLRPARSFRIEVATSEVLYMGSVDDARVRISSERGRAPSIDALLELGERLEPAAAATLRPTPVAPGTLDVPLRPTRRGEARVEALWLRWTGPLGLVERIRRLPLERKIAVIPDIRAVRAEALRFFARRQSVVGQKIERYHGEGSEFESLKEYQPGHDTRGLDWRASARHRKLVVREFQAERNHPVVVAIDTGRLMREPIGGIPRLDRAINAGLLLAYIALKTGDRVGLVAFDSRVHDLVLPRRGIASFPRFQRSCAALEYGADETNYTLALTQVALRLRRRSLIVLFTDFVDSITAELMLDSLKRLGGRHLLLFVALRDPALEALRDAPPRDEDALQRAVVADQLLRERETVFRDLVRRGIQVLDRTPDQVGPGLVQRYLRIRRREMVG